MTSFDHVADTYDTTFTNTTIGRLQRDRVWTYLRTLLPQEPVSILELNCGTGEDALYMAQLGHKVLATDRSQDMLKVVEAKAADNLLQNLLKVGEMDLADPTAVLEDGDRSTQEAYHLVFSNFGGLNCINHDELTVLSNTLKGKLANGSDVVLVIMPRYCLFDLVYRLLHFNIGSIVDRISKDAIEVDVEGIRVKTYYHSPQAAKKAFKGYQHIDTKIIGLYPSYMEKLINKFSFLLHLEDFLVRTFSLLGGPFYRLSDHYLIHLRSNS